MGALTFPLHFSPLPFPSHQYKNTQSYTVLQYIIMLCFSYFLFLLHSRTKNGKIEK